VGNTDTDTGGGNNQAGDTGTGNNQAGVDPASRPGLDPYDMTFLNMDPSMQELPDGRFGGPEDITNVTVDEGSPELSTNWNPSNTTYDATVDPPEVTWTLDREGADGTPERVGESVTPPDQVETNALGEPGDPFGTQAFPDFADPADCRSGTTPAWHPGNYTVGNHSVRRVEFESRANPAARPSGDSVGSGSFEVTIFDTTPPKIEVGMQQPATGAKGLVSLGEAEQSGVDVPAQGTGHQGALLASGNGFSEDMNTEYNSGMQSLDPDLVLYPENNDQIDIGEAMESSPTVDLTAAEPTANGFHIFEDSPLDVRVKVTDNFTQYENSMFFDWALADADGERYTDADGNYVEGSSEGAEPSEDGFYEFTIDHPFNEPNYPTRVTAPDESETAPQTDYFLDIWSQDEDHGCWQNGLPNVAKLRIPIYVHDITPPCEGEGFVVRFHGRDIDDTITITEEPEDHDIAGGEKKIKFTVQGAHLVAEQPFKAEFERPITRPDPTANIMTSVTDFKICEIADTGLQEALMVPEKTRLQIEVKAIDNYTIDALINRAGLSEAGEESGTFSEIESDNGLQPDEPYLTWGVRSMDHLSPDALNNPAMVNLQIANYREGVGFIDHVCVRYTFFVKGRDKAGNTISYELPIYVLDTVFQIHHIAEGVH